jgi:hypothetical protein
VSLTSNKAQKCELNTELDLDGSWVVVKLGLLYCYSQFKKMYIIGKTCFALSGVLSIPLLLQIESIQDKKLCLAIA